MRLDYAGETSPGLVRKRNEDALLMLPRENLFVVADGMGGHEAGDVASRLAVESMAAFFEMTANRDCAAWPHVASGVDNPHGRRLVSSIQHAHHMILKASRSQAELGKMGTTVVALHLAGSAAFLAHVGDSRCYGFSAGRLRRITCDHTVAEQLRDEYDLTAKQKEMVATMEHVVTRALGVGPTEDIAVDLSGFLLREGDMLLLCSDGLTLEVPDADIARILREADSAGNACQRLVREANEAGGRDNVTAVVIKYVEGDRVAASAVAAEETLEATRVDIPPDLIDEE